MLLPHAPTLDPQPYADDVRFLVDRDDATVVRVNVETDPGKKWRTTYWVQLCEKASPMEADGWRCDARLALAYRYHTGKLNAPVLVEGTAVAVDGTDLTAQARRPRVQALFTLPAEP